MLLVHRPRYDDWTFPKGKAENGERDEECAIREVEEETGLACELRDELTTTEYVDGRGDKCRSGHHLYARDAGVRRTGAHGLEQGVHRR